MTSRERILAVLNGKTPDRVPMDLGATFTSGIHLSAYRELREVLGLKGDVRCNDIMQQLAQVDLDVIEALKIDVIQITPVMLVQDWQKLELCPGSPALYPAGLDLTREVDRWVLRDGDGNRYLKPDRSHYFDAEDINTWYEYPVALDESGLAALRSVARKIHEETDLAIVANFGGGFGSMAPDFLMNLLLEPEQIEEELSARCDSLIEFYGKIHQAVGEYTCCIALYSDYGTQNAPAMSPEMFREMIFPHFKRFNDWIHATTGWKVFLHTCGAIEPLIDDLIEMGVDILNPVQTSAAGMEPQKLKEKYGGRIIFWGGGCDTQGVLGSVRGQPLSEHVTERVQLFKRGGRFVFNPVHNIQPSVRAEDVTQVYEAAYEAGRYELANNQETAT